MLRLVTTEAMNEMSFSTVETLKRASPLPRALLTYAATYFRATVVQATTPVRLA